MTVRIAAHTYTWDAEGRLATATPQTVGVARKRRGQDFDGHLAPYSRVPRAVHLPHASCAEWGEELIRAEFRSGREGQWKTMLILSPSAGAKADLSGFENSFG